MADQNVQDDPPPAPSDDTASRPPPAEMKADFDVGIETIRGSGAPVDERNSVQLGGPGEE